MRPAKLASEKQLRYIESLCLRAQVLESDILPEWSDDFLLEFMAFQQDAVEQAQKEHNRLEAEVHRRLQARGATAIMGERFTCEMESRNAYRDLDLAPLKELLTTADLEACYTPAHEVTSIVTESWDKRKVLALAKKYGDQVLAIVEKARYKVERKLVLTPRKER